MDKEMFTFYKNALINNLCTDYKKEFKKDLDDKEKLFELCLRQQAIPFFCTYCYNGDGVTIDYITQNYGAYINGNFTAKDCDKVDGYTYQLWCNYSRKIKITSDVTHAMQCHSKIEIEQSKCPTIYVSNKSSVKLSAKGYNTIIIYLFDESKIDITDLDETCSVLVYEYSDNCSVHVKDECKGKVKEFKKTLRL